MKIEVNGPALSQLPPDGTAKQVSNGSLASTQGATQDWTTFSSDSSSVQSLSVQSLTSQAMNYPEVRQDKVDALSQSISTGAYQVDPTQIAGAIVASEGESMGIGGK